jgi:hypothetical protein
MMFAGGGAICAGGITQTGIGRYSGIGNMNAIRGGGGGGKSTKYTGGGGRNITGGGGGGTKSKSGSSKTSTGRST